MNQFMAINEILDQLTAIKNHIDDKNLLSELAEVEKNINRFLDHGIDFKEVVDEMDDSIFITDSKGNVLYVNPAYTRNTGILADQVLNHNIYDLIKKDKLYTGGAIPDVLKTKKSAFRLSTTFSKNGELKGYVVGTPIFDKNGELRQVVACSRPFISFQSLKTDYDMFLKEIQAIHPNNITKSSMANVTKEFIGRDSSLANISNIISQIAPTDATVLITGESGVGKEVIADEIFKNSLRNNKPFIKLNCAAIPPQLLESELFGYEKGAFSGANTKGKAGLFELANHGTLMLDEIGDMPLDLQVKLLRALQQQEITRIGGSKNIKLDIRFLALTNSDLKNKIAKGSFRQDLYYRLNVIPIQVPPLRARTSDISELCKHFISKFSKKYSRDFTLTDTQYEFMKQYNWPGNIRELENIMEYLVLCSSGIGSVDDNVITSLLDLDIPEQKNYSITSADMNFNQAVSAFEKAHLESVLASSTSLRDAGNKLGLNASTVSRKIKQYNIDYQNKK